MRFRGIQPSMPAPRIRQASAPQVFKDARGLGTFAGAKEVRHRNRGEQRDDGYDDHDLDEREG